MKNKYYASTQKLCDFQTITEQRKILQSVMQKSMAIACASGSFKGAFTHGVLTALESAGIRADAYAAASSSVIPAAWAAIGKAAELG